MKTEKLRAIAEGRFLMDGPTILQFQALQIYELVDLDESIRLNGCIGEDIILSPTFGTKFRTGEIIENISCIKYKFPIQASNDSKTLRTQLVEIIPEDFCKYYRNCLSLTKR